MKDKALQTQALIIGSGIAGLSAAIELAERGVECLVVTAAPEISESNTLYAQGGIIFRSTDKSDADKLEEDILAAGCNLNYRPAVRQLVELGPALVEKLLLKRVEVPFDKDTGTDAFSLTREGGHQNHRILHRGDESGKAIEESLIRYAEKQPAIRFLKACTAVNLLMTSFHCKDRTRLHEEARCFGAFIFDQKSGEVFPIFSQHTLLATGGIGQVFLHGTNSRYSRGDGIALAHRAGCRLENLEYVQFHPTTFYHRTSRRFLISEALRGEGAIIVNQAGERFLPKYLPQFSTPELAPRDRVAKAIHQEMLSTGALCVYLDISHKPAAWIKERFPFVYRNCLENGIDITVQPIPVVPGAHYHCGGVWVDLEGRTSVQRLWAAGEVTCSGVHGANRLASTSLLEGIVWGTQSARSIDQDLKKNGRMEFPEIDPWKSESETVDPSFLTQDWLTLKQTMWNYVGLIKTDQRLKRAEGILTELARGIDVFYRKAKLSDDLIGLRHSSLAAILILDACKRNRRSLGCYLREELEI